ncbi:MAG: hypothetical protein AABZ74_10860 [Cyanobacteriota bacterium]
MKIKELLESKNTWKQFSEDIKQEVFSKINYAIIDLLDTQEDIDISAFIQKLANLLSEDNQKNLVSTINFLIINDKIKNNLENVEKIRDSIISNELNSKISEQISSSIKAQVNEEVKEKFQQAITNQISEAVSNNIASNISDIQMSNAIKNNIAMNNQNTVNPEDEYLIDEDGGSALGIVLGRTTKTEVLMIMRKYSTKFNNTATLNIGKQITYDDVSVTFIFNDQKIVKGITFGKLYKGKTSKGVKTGDKMDKAIESYGQPQYKTPYSCVWQEMAVFCDQPNVISSIRLQI